VTVVQKSVLQKHNVGLQVL